MPGPVSALSALKGYRRADFRGDITASVIVALMLVPQGMAYAMLAGLPVQVGLYASMLPLVAYAVLGSSRTLAVGPVALVSLLTATAIQDLGLVTAAEKMAAAVTLAAMSGLVLLIMGVLRLGAIATVLSHPVVSGFTTAAALAIALGQIRHLFGVSASGEYSHEIILNLAASIGDINAVTLIIGGLALVLLFAARGMLPRLLRMVGVAAGTAEIAGRIAPAVVVVLATLVAAGLELGTRAGVATVGLVPPGLPPLSVPVIDPGLWRALLPAALLISLIGFVESVSVAQTLAAKRRQTIDPNRELLGLGLANGAAALTSGYPVTGGFARSAVNFAAGAETQLAGVFSAGLIALAALFLTPYFAHMPQAVLAATIIVAVLGLVDFQSFGRTWRYSRADGVAQLATAFVVFFINVETGLVLGIALSLILYLWRSSRPHMAVVGRVPGTEHYRNVLRHAVKTDPTILAIRVDESLYFLNARYLEDRVQSLVAERPQVRHVVLICSAVNVIDASALESLETLCGRLADAGVKLHLAEIKGPVMDGLEESGLFSHLTGQVFLSTHAAFVVLSSKPDAAEA